MTYCVTDNRNKLQRKDTFPERKKHDIETNRGVKDDGCKSIATQNEASLERETIKRNGGDRGVEKVGVSKRKMNNEIDNIKMNMNREKSNESGMRHKTKEPRKKISDIICTPFSLYFTTEGRTVQPALSQALTKSFTTLTEICIIPSNILRMNLVSQHMRLWL